MRARWAILATTAMVLAAVLAGPARALEPVGSLLLVSQQGPPGEEDFVPEAAEITYNPDRDEYLVVWHGEGGPGLVIDEFEIWGQRLAAGTGARVGDVIRISDMGTDGTTETDAREPAVAYSTVTHEYLVVWNGEDDTPPDGEEIWGQRLSGAGAELGANDFRISAMGPDGDTGFAAFLPDVTFNSTNGEYLVVWRGSDDAGALVSGEFETFGQRLSATGTEVGADDFRISSMGPDGSTGFDSSSATVTFNPVDAEYLVAWSGNDDAGALDDDHFEIFGQRLSAAGAETGPDDFRISTTGEDSDPAADAALPDVVFNLVAREYLVAWVSNDADPAAAESEVYAQRLDRSGAAVGVDIRVTRFGPDGDGNYGAVDVAVTADTASGEYLVVTAAFDDTLALGELEIFGQSLSAAGAEVGPDDLRLTHAGPDGATLTPAVQARVAARNDGTFLVILKGTDHRVDGLVFGDFEILAQRVQGAVVDGPQSNGYRLTSRDGGVFSFGQRGFHGSLGGVPLHAPIVASLSTPTGNGYWLVGADGGLFAFGDAPFFGSLGGIALSAPIVAAIATASGDGAWLVGADGAVYALGDAPFFGSLIGTRLSAPIVAAISGGDGGAWLVGADGGVYALGNAPFFGSLGGLALSAPITAAIATETGNGYWLFGRDGAVYALGDARFFGSLFGTRLNRPVVAAFGTGADDGYTLAGADGGVFAFGAATFEGSTGAFSLNEPIVAGS